MPRSAVYASAALMILGWIGLGALTVVYPSASRLHTWPWAPLATLGWGTLVIGCVGLLVARGEWRRPPTAVSVGLLGLAAVAVLAAAAGPFAAASFPRVWPTLGGVALVFVLHHVWSAPGAAPEAPARLLGAVGLVFVGVSLLGWTGGTLALPWGSRNAVPFGHSTYVAGAVVLLVPWLVLAGARARGPRQAVHGVVAAGGLLVLASTGSRGGVLALVAVAGAAGAGLLFSGRIPRGAKLAVVAGLLAVGVGAVATNARLRELVVERRWGETAAESNVQRSAMIDAGLRLGTQRPLLGWGPGAVPLAYPRVRAELDGGVDNVLQLHATPLQLWATLGAGGVSVAAWLLGAVAWAAWRAPRTPVAFAATASLAGYGVMALTDHQLDVPFFTAFVAANVAVLTAAGPAAGAAPRAGRLAAAGVLALGAGLALPATVRDLRARQAYETALVALGAGREAEFHAALERAADLAPHDPFYLHQRAGRALESWAVARDPEPRAALARTATDALERSLAAGVFAEFAHFNLGWLQLEAGAPDVAARHFAAAARLVPDKGGVYFGLGLAHLEAGRREAAVRAFALEWLNDPRSATSPTWEVVTLAPLVPAVRAEAQRLGADVRAPAAAWAAWWWRDPGVAAPAPPAGFNAATRAFAAAWPAPAPLATRWAQAHAAWRARGDAAAFLGAAGGDAALAAALSRRARTHADDFHAFLTAPPGAEAALVRTFRRARSGYGVLALHPEGPVLHDAFIVQEHRVAADVAGELFPRKGWLPGRFLLALLPADPR